MLRNACRMKPVGCVLNPTGCLIRVVSSVRVERTASRTMKMLQLGAILAVASVLVYPITVQAIGIGNAYVEVGDAGNSLNAPQFITGGPYDGIAGSIDDSVDVFAFHWIGGDFVAKFFSGADPAIALYDFSQNLLGSASGLAPVLTINNVTAGNYLFEISTLTGSDPNAVHLTITGIQSWRIFIISSPLRDGCCLVRRLTTRGFDRPFGLVSLPLAAALINANHHFWKFSGGNGTAVWKFAADQ